MTTIRNPKTTPHVAVLMGVLNGAPYLKDQLKSIAAQVDVKVTLTCSDDGSNDQSQEVIASFAKQNALPIHQSCGPGTGFSDNYMGLVRALPSNPGYVSFADQDDIWAPNKLARGFNALRNSGETPTLYCARRWIWYPKTKRQIASASHALPFNFQNALIENIAAGNTIVLNPAAARLARHSAQRTGPVFAHDWWLYLLITGVGGRIIFDNGSPCMHYRQHANNAIGERRGLAYHTRRKLSVLRGVFADRLDHNIAAMNSLRDILTPAASKTLT